MARCIVRFVVVPGRSRRSPAQQGRYRCSTAWNPLCGVLCRELPPRVDPRSSRPRDFKKYFPKRRVGIGERWKFVIKALAAEPNPRILSKPSCGGADWPAFIDLVEYRDGLVHANARPERTAARPIPGSSWRHGARFARTCRGRSCAKSTRGCLGDRTRRTPEKTFTFASRRLTSQKSP
jgi:hypothetical protein